MKNKSVVLGMSGGVDSSVAALILKKQGYKVIGVFLKNFSDTKNKFTGECWWREELNIARTIANKLDIPLHVIDYEKIYRNKVIKPMIKSYAKNQTPNPDIDCNNLTKFPALLQAMKKYKADFISTGHYAQIKKLKGKFLVLQGADSRKDQSYFLYKLTQKYLSQTLFPIGNKTKEEIREIAKQNNFPNWDKHGSAGVCFIGPVSLIDYLKNHIKHKEGKVVDPRGRTIGTHKGTQLYTIGQKAVEHIGINIDKGQQSQERFYIAKKLPNNTLLVAVKGSEILKTKSVTIKELYSPSGLKIKSGPYLARYRHLGQLVNGKLSKNKNKWFFTFSHAQPDIAPGQSIVLYKDSVLIAGGEIYE